MKNAFNQIQLLKPKKSFFDLSHDVKLTADLGKLIPVCCIEAMPTDKFNIGCQSLIRFSPLIAPVMHRYDVSVHYFFVPHRVLWPNWEDYITGNAVHQFPFIQISDLQLPTATNGSLADYLGLPKPGVGGVTRQVSAVPFAVYQMIYNEYYRDQNLSPEINFSLIDGNNNGNSALWQLRNRNWEHDYFTSCLPWAQKGGSVSLPIAGFEDVLVKFEDNPDTSITQWKGTGFTDPGNVSANAFAPAGQSTQPAGIQNNFLYAETSQMTASSAAINDLRRAFQLQKWLELDARAGSRYFEKILAHFGYKGPDARLQRPEYITGIKTPIIVSEVLNTAATAGVTDGRPQGDMAGHAVGVAQGRYGSYFCQEHGYIMGIMSVMPKTAYQDGIPKHFLKTNDPYEYAWPLFAGLGEQPVLNKEVCAWGAAPEDVFGYLPMYQEYRFEQNRVAGDFRESLDFWHHGRKFDPATPPVLDHAFVQCTPDKRIFAVTDNNVNSLYCHHLNKIGAVRPLPKYGTPLGI